jgi:hypothetical protein
LKDGRCRLKDKGKRIKEFNKINGLPAWGGVIAQKRLLAAFTIKQARRHQVWLKKRSCALPLKEHR